MNFFKRRKPQDEENHNPDSPIIVIRLVDGTNLDVAIEWPKNCDIRPFAQVLTLLNSGSIIAPQLAAAAVYASYANQPEQAMVINDALSAVMNAKKKKTVSGSDDDPIVLPSKVLNNQMKYYGI